MLLIRHEDIAQLLTIQEVIQAVKAGLLEQAQGQVQLPPRLTVDSTSGHGWLRLMSVVLNGSGLMGFKAMHSTPGVGVRYFVMLYDLKSGSVLAQVDAGWLTAQRTAATAAIATDLLAKRRIKAISVIGSSEQARALLTAIKSIRTFDQVKVFSPNEQHRRSFAVAMGKELNVTTTPVNSAEEAVIKSDLVLSAYRANRFPALLGEWIEPGMHINAISAVRPEFREFDDAVWRNSDVIAVDDREHVLTCGDGRGGIERNVLRPGSMIELWELVSGKRQGREKDTEITLFKSVGNALQDLVLTAAIYKKAKDKGIGEEVTEFPRVVPVK